MKHMDINPLIEAVKEIETQEAARILKVCGRRKSFKENKAPTVDYRDVNGTAATARVKSIRVTGGNHIVISVTGTGEETEDVEASRLYPGSLMRIVDAI